jgi:hypothetical protein
MVLTGNDADTSVNATLDKTRQRHFPFSFEVVLKVWTPWGDAVISRNTYTYDAPGGETRPSVPLPAQGGAEERAQHVPITPAAMKLRRDTFSRKNIYISTGTPVFSKRVPGK